MALEHCPVCATPAGIPFLVWDGVPVHCHRLYDDRDAARDTPRGRIELCACPTCTALFNRAFDPAAVGYGPGYDNPLDHAPTFAAWQDEQARGLVSTYALGDGLAVEIGCGRGGFLRALARHGARRLEAFEPAWNDGWDAPARARIHRSRFDPGRLKDRPSLVLARHLLEHLPEPRQLLRALKGCAAPLVLEVPAGERTQTSEGLWDVIYEHCTHFTAEALSWLLSAEGYAVERVERTFGDQFLVAHGRPSSRAPAGPALQSAPVRRQAAPPDAASSADLETISAALAERRWAVWGMGSKGITLLNRLEAGNSIAVDLNPDKRGRFVPGSGHRIHTPAELPAFAPEGVLLMNPRYRREVAATLAALGLACPLMTPAELVRSAAGDLTHG